MQLDVAALGLEVDDAIARIRDHGVRLSQTRPGVLRAVTHMDVTDDDIDIALESVPAALGAHVHA